MDGLNPNRCNVYLTPEEKAFLEERAKKHNMKISEYLRFAAFFESVTGGDPGAEPVLGKRLSVHTKDVVHNWYERFKKGAKKAAEKK